MTTTLHVQRDGATPGRMVVCPAQKKCRIGGRHIEQHIAIRAHDWITDQGTAKPIRELTSEDVESFLIAHPDTKYTSKADQAAYEKALAAAEKAKNKWKPNGTP